MELFKKINNKKVSIIILAILIGAIIGILLFISIDKKTSEEEKINNIILENFKEVGYSYIYSNSLEYVSVEYLLNNNMLEGDYINLKCYIVDIDNNLYEDCDINNSLINEPIYLITTYINQETVKYTNIISDDYTLEITLINITNYKGLYDEYNNLVSESNIVNASLLNTGSYKILTENGYKKVFLYKDDNSPVLSDYSIIGNIVNTSYSDEYNYDVFYYYTDNYIDSDNLKYEVFNSELNISVSGLYYIYTFAKDRSNNYSVISYIGEMNYKDNFLYMEVK